MTSAEEPCHKGARIRSYSKKLCLEKWLEQVSRVFKPDDLQMSEVTPILSIPKELNINNVQEVSSLCGSPSVKKFLSQAKSFQRDAVKKWNPEADEPTQSNHAGLVAMDEAASKECGALALDLLIKFRIMMKVKDGTYDIAPDFEAKRAYLFGDVKTVDNVDKFVSNLANRPLSLQESSEKAETFSKALQQMM